MLYWNASASWTVIDLMNFSAAADDDEIPEELLLGKHQLSELSSESAKIKAMGIMHKVGTRLLCQQERLRPVIRTGDIINTKAGFCLPHLFMLTTFYPQIPSDKMVKVQSILEKNIQDGAKLSTLMNHVSIIVVSIGRMALPSNLADSFPVLVISGQRQGRRGAFVA